MSANTETTGADFEHQALCPVERGGSCNCVPIAAPAAHKIEVRATVDGKCPLCGVAVPSTHIHVCGGSLRPTAPAAHIERRKGQRWRMERLISPTMTMEGTLSHEQGDTRNRHWVLDDVKRTDRTDVPNPSGAFYQARWNDTDYVMTLLADDSPESAKSSQLNCAKCGRSTDVCQFACTDRGACELTDCPCLAKSPPAQEAPKVAPVQFWFTDDEGEKIGPFATVLEADDASVTYGAWMRTQTGKPYAGPERLPCPQLAADWVEDCLPESGR